MSSWFLWWFDGGPHQASRHSLFARLMFLFFCTRLNFLIARSWNASENEFIWSWTYLIKSISLFSPLGSLDTEPRRNTNSRNCNSPHKRRGAFLLSLFSFFIREKSTVFCWRKLLVIANILFPSFAFFQGFRVERSQYEAIWWYRCFLSSLLFE